MSQPLVTFIIPAYNVARYLRQCIDSVYRLDLSGHEREVIVVDDGSTDNTDEVLSRCREVYDTLQTIRQSNCGLSVARNNAMDIATGKYICFVDADDLLVADNGGVAASGTLSVLVKAMESGRNDIIGVDLLQRDKNGRQLPYRRYVPIYNKVYAPAALFMQGRNLFPCVWAYLFRREFVEREGLRFRPSVYHEDEDFTVKAFVLGCSFVALPVCWYVRRLRQGSITTTVDRSMQQRRLRDVLKILSGLDAFFERNAGSEVYARCKMDYLVVDLLRVMLRQRHPKAFRREIVSALRGMGRFPLRWRWEPKYILFNLLTRVIL